MDNTKTAKKPSKPVTLTKKQLEESVAVELLATCQSVAEDGKLTNEEISELELWLTNNKGNVELPAITFLSNLVAKILADKVVTESERKELFDGIQRVLPKDIREITKATRKQVETGEREKNRPVDVFDFMVAGAKRRENQEMIEAVREGEQVYFIREPYNDHDKNATIVSVGKNYPIGYVPREDAREMAKLLDGGFRYSAQVKKILGYNKLIPVVVANFYSEKAEIKNSQKQSNSVSTKSSSSWIGWAILLWLLMILLLSQF